MPPESTHTTSARTLPSAPPTSSPSTSPRPPSNTDAARSDAMELSTDHPLAFGAVDSGATFDQIMASAGYEQPRRHASAGLPHRGHRGGRARAAGSTTTSTSNAPLDSLLAGLGGMEDVQMDLADLGLPVGDLPNLSTRPFDHSFANLSSRPGLRQAAPQRHPRAPVRQSVGPVKLKQNRRKKTDPQPQKTQRTHIQNSSRPESKEPSPDASVGSVWGSQPDWLSTNNSMGAADKGARAVAELARGRASAPLCVRKRGECAESDGRPAHRYFRLDDPRRALAAIAVWRARHLGLGAHDAAAGARGRAVPGCRPPRRFALGALVAHHASLARPHWSLGLEPGPLDERRHLACRQAPLDRRRTHVVGRHAQAQAARTQEHRRLHRLHRDQPGAQQEAGCAAAGQLDAQHRHQRAADAGAVHQLRRHLDAAVAARSERPVAVQCLRALPQAAQDAKAQEPQEPSQPLARRTHDALGYAWGCVGARIAGRVAVARGRGGRGRHDVVLQLWHLHNEHRPVTMRADVIKKRSRYDEKRGRASTASSRRTSPQPQAEASAVAGVQEPMSVDKPARAKSNSVTFQLQPSEAKAAAGTSASAPGSAGVPGPSWPSLGNEGNVAHQLNDAFATAVNRFSTGVPAPGADRGRCTGTGTGTGTWPCAGMGSWAQQQAASGPPSMSGSNGTPTSSASATSAARARWAEPDGHPDAVGGILGASGAGVRRAPGGGKVPGVLCAEPARRHRVRRGCGGHPQSLRRLGWLRAE
ncbi:hypothetical protein L1887_47185 [Cichorium endivia]|nr:hypothetical protein L1887_47185 [Cichorium endivia]